MLKFSKQNQNRLRSIFRTWFESFLVFELVFHYTDLVKKSVIIPTVFAAVIPVVLRYLNPKDSFPD